MKFYDKYFKDEKEQNETLKDMILTCNDQCQRCKETNEEQGIDTNDESFCNDCEFGLYISYTDYAWFIIDHSQYFNRGCRYFRIQLPVNSITEILDEIEYQAEN